MGLLDALRARRGTVAGPDAPPVVPVVVRPAQLVGRRPVSAGWREPCWFRAGGNEVRVVGEASCQDALEAAAGGRTEDGARIPMVTAELVAEPTNPYDPGAVRVDVAGRCVGYIPRDETARFHPLLRLLASEGKPATCRARLTGGWDRGGGDRGHFGIVLDLHERLEVLDRPLSLPFGRGRVSIVGEEAMQGYLLQLLGGVPKQEAVASLHSTHEGIAVALGGYSVGRLTPTMASRYRPWVDELSAEGIEATCEARIIHGTKKVDVFLKLAMPGTS
jgi:hypothetical protein